jgi:hypothetical protein
MQVDEIKIAFNIGDPTPAWVEGAHARPSD